MKILRIALLAILATLAYSCSSDLETSTNQESELDAATAKKIMNTSELSGFADTIIGSILNSDLSDKAARSNDCYTVVTTEQTSTITFTECVIDGSDAINGSISATSILKDNQLGMRVTYTDLTVGEIQLTGTRELFYSVDSQTNRTIISINNDIQLVLEDDSIVIEKGSKVIWYETDNSENQRISIDGQWEFTTNNRVYDIVIEENLETVLPCEYISSGLMKISEGQANAFLDFGDGTCDDITLFTHPDGTTEEITLRD